MCSFESSSEKSDRVSKACRQIQLAHHSRPAYLLNISVAYDILGQNKGDASSGFTVNINDLITLVKCVITAPMIMIEGCDELIV